MRVVLLALLSWGCIAFGQPWMSATLSICASIFGFALFWLSLFELKKFRFLYATSWFFAVQLIQLSWFATPAYQGNYIFVVYGALALWLGLEFGVLTLFFPKKGPIETKKIFMLAAIWVLLEWSRLFVLCGFAWNLVGLSLTAFPLSAQFASVGGVFALSFLVILTNLFTLNLILAWNSRSFLLFFSCAAFPYLFGFFHIDFHEKRISKIDSNYNIALVQTALLPDEKSYTFGKEERWVHPFIQWQNIFSYLKRYQGKELHLIALPEYALPFEAYSPIYPYEQIIQMVGGNLSDHQRLLQSSFVEKKEGELYVSNAFLCQLLADRYGAELVAGLDVTDKGLAYSSALHFTPQSVNISRYEKRVLLPMVEYLPFSFLKPLVARYGIHHFFSHGQEAKVIDGAYPLALSICYEECFSHVIRQGRKKGGAIFVNVTNDGWYPSSRLAEAHYVHGRLRAIENGAPLLRSCNTGVTAGVDSLGRTVARLGEKGKAFESERGALFFSLTPYSFPTLYTFWGNNFILVVIFLSLLSPFFKKKICID